ncbi:hypothetical protein GUITHDRAFT_113241 [Guillardia theta CCMP2712]|uniref:Uncharacterized protein n=1 Tax=Guillardia theta (strain CCMP2712) TaxID=905079 RepID=L1IXV3_GUITC|nr:hypothetical protein GUITHDRAFT_113241 [Guillardia theta CCMP2712]EKX40709.1 hypothetical protein GUITHDRAFT_113241 [Guillardia theta CCMP2712]|eukprot:XP_005827689.1 hypothetical protein GUITHDRAFT_113241 [Guillardia theta CCMP2712]
METVSLAFTNNNSSSALISSKQNSLDDWEETLSSRRNWDSENQNTFLNCDHCPIYDEMLLSQDSKLRVTRVEGELRGSHSMHEGLSATPLNSCILPVVRPLEDMVESVLKKISEWMLGPVAVYEIDELTGQVKIANARSSFLESENDMSRAEKFIRPIYNSAKSAYRRMKSSSQPLIDTAKIALKSFRGKSSTAGDLLVDNRVSE